MYVHNKDQRNSSVFELTNFTIFCSYVETAYVCRGTKLVSVFVTYRSAVSLTHTNAPLSHKQGSDGIIIESANWTVMPSLAQKHSAD